MTSKQADPKPIIAFDLSGTLADVLKDSPKDEHGIRIEEAVPGAREFLDRLRLNYRVIVVSGGSFGSADLSLEGLGVQDEDAFMGYRNKGQLLEGLGSDLAVVAYVGDGADDVKGPANEGIPVVVFTWDRPEKPDATKRIRAYHAEGLAKAGLNGVPVAFGFTELESALRTIGVEVAPATDRAPIPPLEI